MNSKLVVFKLINEDLHVMAEKSTLAEMWEHVRNNVRIDDPFQYDVDEYHDCDNIGSISAYSLVSDFKTIDSVPKSLWDYRETK